MFYVDTIIVLTFNTEFLLQELINLEEKDKSGKTILHHVAERGILTLWDIIADRKGFEASINYANCQFCTNSKPQNVMGNRKNYSNNNRIMLF